FERWARALASAEVPRRAPAVCWSGRFVRLGADETDASDDGRCDARRAASARRSRERGRTPLFDQYEDGDRPRAANE
ncbi:hypothetical protein P1P68_36475, partial [Streptomyces scabiei]|nr:hypothetical protein [Streptomyces scabiei]